MKQNDNPPADADLAEWHAFCDWYCEQADFPQDHDGMNGPFGRASWRAWRDRAIKTKEPPSRA